MRSFLAAAALAAALPACDSLDTFDVPLEGSATIPGDPLGAVPVLDLALPLLPPFDFKDQKAFENAGVGADDLESVKLQSLQLEVMQPAGGSFDFLDSVHVYAEVEGRERKLVAVQDPVPAGVSELALDVRGVELKPFVAADEMILTTEVKGRPPAQDTILKARAVFEVNAAIF